MTLRVFMPCALAAVAACSGNSASPARHATISVQAAQTSTNWSGYVLTGALLGYTAVSGDWVVPALDCAGGATGSSSSWVGIGGGETQDPTLIQAGTVQDCDAGSASYSAWWEVIPAPSVTASDIPLVGTAYEVQPGDHMSVNIASTGVVLWDISIANLTRGWTFSTSVSYPAAGKTAEWIEEAPLTAGAGGAGQATLANYGRVTFTHATVNGANPHLTTAASIAMVDGNNAVISTPSDPAASGDAFSVCYGAANCAAP